jgi:hypothetical protein
MNLQLSHLPLLLLAWARPVAETPLSSLLRVVSNSCDSKVQPRFERAVAMLHSLVFG